MDAHILVDELGGSRRKHLDFSRTFFVRFWMINPQRLVKPVINWSRKSLVPFVTPLSLSADGTMRVSARVLLPRTYEVQSRDIFQSLKKPSMPSPIDLRLLAQRIGKSSDNVFSDTTGSFLYINFVDHVDPGKYRSTAVVFPDGSLVTWYMKKEEEMDLAADILSFHRAGARFLFAKEATAIDLFDGLESMETIPVSSTPVERTTLVGGEAVALTTEESNRSNDMLAVSMALSSAVRMNAIEAALKDYIKNGHSDISNSTRRVDQWKLSQLSESIFESEKGVHKWRYFLTSTNQTGVPDLLWEYEQLDQLFDEVANHFEIEERFGDLQNQLTYYSEYLRTVGDYVRHGYSSRLEKIIILIIAIEACVALRHLFVDLVGH